MDSLLLKVIERQIQRARLQGYFHLIYTFASGSDQLFVFDDTFKILRKERKSIDHESSSPYMYLHSHLNREYWLQIIQNSIILYGLLTPEKQYNAWWSSDLVSSLLFSSRTTLVIYVGQSGVDGSVPLYLQRD